MKKIIVALLAIMTYTSCNAAELAIIGHGISKHLDNHNFNERDYGAALRYQEGEFGIQIGDYHNSIRKNTVYAGFDWSPIHFNVSECLNVEVGIFAGSATGYKYAVTPITGLQAAVRCNNVFVRARIIPDVIYNSKAVGAIEFGIVLLKF